MSCGPCSATAPPTPLLRRGHFPLQLDVCRASAVASEGLQRWLPSRDRRRHGKGTEIGQRWWVCFRPGAGDAGCFIRIVGQGAELVLADLAEAPPGRPAACPAARARRSGRP